jgi:hypothetical protein
MAATRTYADTRQPAREGPTMRWDKLLGAGAAILMLALRPAALRVPNLAGGIDSLGAA